MRDVSHRHRASRDDDNRSRCGRIFDVDGEVLRAEHRHRRSSWLILACLDAKSCEVRPRRSSRADVTGRALAAIVSVNGGRRRKNGAEKNQEMANSGHVNGIG
jgi:hypothetical protein